jgi:hypothetical protein
VGRRAEHGEDRRPIRRGQRDRSARRLRAGDGSKVRRRAPPGGR